MVLPIAVMWCRVDKPTPKTPFFYSFSQKKKKKKKNINPIFQNELIQAFYANDMNRQQEGINCN